MVFIAERFLTVAVDFESTDQMNKTSFVA